MPVYALFAWIITGFGGLFLLAIWLIEYDPDYQRADATRLPISVISGHVLLALTGLAVWIIYLITDMQRLAWLTVAILAVVVSFGITMAVRWVGVYRAHKNPNAPIARHDGDDDQARAPVPPERHFPVPVVIGHGVLAATTIVLVLLTTLGVGGS